MKNLFLIPLLIGLCGCAQMSQLLQPQQGDAIVIRAEQLADTGFQVVDAFLKYEKDNRVTLQASNISLKAAADDLRRKFPPAYHDFRTMIKLYKGNPTPDNRDLLTRSIEIIRGLIAVAETHLAGGVLYPAYPNGAPPSETPQPSQVQLDTETIITQLGALNERLDAQNRNIARISAMLRNSGLTNGARFQIQPLPALPNGAEPEPNDRQNR